MKLFYTYPLHLLLFLILCIHTSSYSQCTENATNFGNNTTVPRYNISGDVSVTLNTNNTVSLHLASNFSTAAGPDIRAYLVNSNGMSNTEIRAAVHNVNNGIANLDTISFGIVNATGEQSFSATISSDKDITKYDKVFFYCLQYSQFWDIGSFTPFTTNNCSILTTQENTLATATIYPNPASNTIQLGNIDTSNAEICIFDFSGKKVFQKAKGKAQNTFDISNLKTGLYVLSISKNNKQFSKKLIIQ